MCKLNIFRPVEIKRMVMLLLLGASVNGVLLAQSIEIDGEIFRDPTQPPWAVMSGSPDSMSVEVDVPSGPDFSLLRLSFVRAGGLAPVAVINNRQYSLGDEIEGAEIVAIRSGEVVFSIDGEERILSTFSNSVRQAIE